MIASTESEKTPLRYAGIPGHWDEAVLASGLPRRHWRDLYVEVGRMGMRQLNRRWHSGQQLIQSEGITYNPSSLTEGSEYTWLTELLAGSGANIALPEPTDWSAWDAATRRWSP